MQGSRAFKIVVAYATLGILWVTISVIIFFKMEGNKATHTLIMGSVSAALFIALTGWILYYLISLHYSKLQESEKQYRGYFEENPAPMWIYDRETLRFTAVNDAAVHHYGYSREEFYHMTILDIRPQEDKEKVKAAVSEFKSSYKDSGVWTHKKKDGTLIYVHINSHLINSTDGQHVMIMASDISQRLQAETQLQAAYSELIKQNNTLTEIAWSESHNVRRPLASILGLITILEQSDDEEEKERCFKFIKYSALELDDMIRTISAQINDTFFDQ